MSRQLVHSSFSTALFQPQVRTLIAMDTLQQIVHNFAVVVGLNHLRTHSLYYLGEMRFDTLRTRVTKVDHKLSRQNVMSLYTLWLQSRAFYVEFSALPIKEWCSNLAELRCSGQGVMDTWEDSLHDPQYYHGALTHKDTALLRRVYNSIKDYYDKKGGKRPQQTGASRYPLRSRTANTPPVDNSGFFKQTTAPATGKSKSQSLPSKPRGNQEADLKRSKGTACVERRTLGHSQAPKSLEKGMCRRCRATGEIFPLPNATLLLINLLQVTPSLTVPQRTIRRGILLRIQDIFATYAESMDPTMCGIVSSIRPAAQGGRRAEMVNLL